MKINITIVLLSLIISKVGAQKSIFIRPLIAQKVNYSSFPGDGLKSPLNYSGNDYYTFYNYGLHYKNNTLDLGIGIGLKLNEKEQVELTLAGDNASVKSAVVYNSNYSSYLNGTSLFRTTFDYQYQSFSAHRLNLRIVAGTGLLFSSQNSIDFDSVEIELGNFSIMGIDKVQRYKRISPFIKMGLGFDIKSKTEKQICSLDIFWIYSMGKSFISNTKNLFVTENALQVTNSLTHAIVSNGSGFCFQLSFPIQIFTLGKKSDE
jgi:hypothetical protein